MDRNRTKDAIRLLRPLLPTFDRDPQALKLTSTALRELALWVGRAFTAGQEYETAEHALHRALLTLEKVVGEYTWDFVAVAEQLAILYASTPMKAIRRSAAGRQYVSRGLEASKAVWEDADRLPLMGLRCGKALGALGEEGGASAALRFALDEAHNRDYEKMQAIIQEIEDQLRMLEENP